jgi:hypothetical protein
MSRRRASRRLDAVPAPERTRETCPIATCIIAPAHGMQSSSGVTAGGRITV